MDSPRNEVPVQKRGRKWTITWNNKNKKDIEKVLGKFQDKIKYMIASDEIAPTTGTPHVQAYMETKSKVSLSTVKNWFDRGIHLELARTSQEHNTTYCSKEDPEPLVFGEPDRPGTRTDIQSALADIKAGKTWEQLNEDHGEVLVKYPSGMKLVKSIQEKSSRTQFRSVRVEVHYGKTGTGKTRYAMSQPNVYKISPPYDWFDGYEGEDCLVIDEYDSQLPIQRLLSILDGYQLRLPIKGSFTYANWTRVIITSNIRPSEWHSKAKLEHLLALSRRITTTTEY